ncbi:MAG: nucleotidyltransferase, partial [Gammaproteobacteria bacterium]|nr:nucleotidyltransferase [Gammaproteobacteria bacterium]
GVEDVTVVVGFGAEFVDALVARRDAEGDVRTLYNPDFAVADNLFSCWMARGEMDEDFVLLNGDTVFEPGILRRLLDSPAHPVTLAINRKAHYDDDDMKVQREGDRLLKVGKDLPLDQVDGESIGMMVFRGNGPALFRRALENAVKRKESRKQYYLSVIAELAKAGHVWTQDISGLEWSEVDYPLDLVRASKMAAGWTQDGEGREATRTAGPMRVG